MRKDEFVEIHGEEAWAMLVAPRKRDSRWPAISQANANILADGEVIRFLAEHGLAAENLLDAQAEWEALHPSEFWDTFLIKTLFSQEYYDLRLQAAVELLGQ